MSDSSRQCYDSCDETDSSDRDSVDEEPLRRRAESVAVLSWRLVCSCMIRWYADMAASGLSRSKLLAKLC